MNYFVGQRDGDNAGPSNFGNVGSMAPQRSVFQEGMAPDRMGEAYRPYRDGNDQGNGNQQYTYIDRIAEQKNLHEAEDLDLNAAIHGNWTIENGKSRLHIFLQTNNIKVSGLVANDRMAGVQFSTIIRNNLEFSNLPLHLWLLVKW